MPVSKSNPTSLACILPISPDIVFSSEYAEEIKRFGQRLSDQKRMKLFICVDTKSPFVKALGKDSSLTCLGMQWPVNASIENGSGEKLAFTRALQHVNADYVLYLSPQHDLNVEAFDGVLEHLDQIQPDVTLLEVNQISSSAKQMHGSGAEALDYLFECAKKSDRYLKSSVSSPEACCFQLDDDAFEEALVCAARAMMNDQIIPVIRTQGWKDAGAIWGESCFSMLVNTLTWAKSVSSVKQLSLFESPRSNTKSESQIESKIQDIAFYLEIFSRNRRVDWPMFRASVFLGALETLAIAPNSPLTAEKQTVLHLLKTIDQSFWKTSSYSFDLFGEVFQLINDWHNQLSEI